MIYVIYDITGNEVKETQNYEEALRYLMLHPNYKIRKFLLIVS